MYQAEDPTNAPYVLQLAEALQSIQNDIQAIRKQTEAMAARLQESEALRKQEAEAYRKELERRDAAQKGRDEAVLEALNRLSTDKAKEEAAESQLQAQDRPKRGFFAWISGKQE
ncbi:hypothetical protein PO902_14165 [Planococcus maritimus]|nr:hypothetical protein [Planococcus sp. SK3692]MDE4086188.1 hypothetical protein [Planococcus maritimus]